MLVLSRKVGESFVIGNNMRVQVIRVQGGRVKLAIEAPMEVVIRRQELIGGDDSEDENSSSKVGQNFGSIDPH